MKRLLLLVFLMVLGRLAYSYENTYAIIIGVADYKYGSIYSGDLRYTVNDARKFYEFLKSDKGGSVPASNIVLLTDARASKANIITQAKALFARAKTNDRVILYFSGHGKEGCFLPYDADYFGRRLLLFTEIKSLFRYAKCTTKLLFSDAFFSGSMKENMSSNTGLRRVMERNAKVSSSNMNIAVMMSCQDDEYSLELTDLQQGVFTYYLMQGLSGKANSDESQYITIQELFYYVYHRVKYKAALQGSAQTPVLFGTFDLKLVVGKI